MTEWYFVAGLMSAALLFFLLWKELKRKNKQLLFWRIMFTTLAVGSLAALAFPLYYNKNVKDFPANEAILLTEGYRADSLNRFLASNGNHLPVYQTEDSKRAENSGSQYIPDIYLPIKGNANISTFHVFGYGFDENEWKRFPNVNVVFHPSPLPYGITDVHWNQLCKNGEVFTVQGICNNQFSAKYKLVLTSFGETLDSAYVSGDSSAAFTLATTPKGKGRMLYKLIGISGKDTLEQHPVPMQITEDKPLKILMLASSPDFDNKFLKNTLAKEGYEIAVRTTISKNKYAYDYLNMANVSLTTMTSSLLEKFDIVVADASELSHLPGSQLSAIQNVVAQKNIGLVIKEDSVISSSFYARFFPVITTIDSAQQVRLFFPDTLQNLPPINIDNPASIRYTSNMQSIVSDKQNKVYAGVALYGSGKIVFTTLSNTYTWALAGNEEAYHAFWSALLNKALATPMPDEWWSTSPSLPRVNEPVQINLQTNHINNIPQAQVSNTPVYLKSNPDLHYQWSGTYWPKKEGWQMSTTTEGKPFYWYAFSPADWQNVQASRKILASQQYISSHLYKEKEAENILTEKTEFPKLYFFILFLISAGFLWAEGKGLFSKYFTTT